MTQEQKAYDKANNLAREWLETKNGYYMPKELCEEIFSELKESEDERIRKSIIAILNNYVDNSNTFKPKMLAWLEKHKENVEDADAANSDETSLIPDEDKQKFSIGDWVTDDGETYFHIISYANHTYQLETVDGTSSHFHQDFIESKYRLWSIEDAKVGDVLATDKSVFIYAKVLYNKPYAYCSIDKYGIFKDNCLKNNWANSVDNIRPATKEQRDILFAKMHEARYEWDAKKKELRKIEPKFHEGDWVINRFDDNVWHIDSLDKKNYQVSDVKGNYNYFPISKQDGMHLWSIADAKDGDVLVTTFEEDNIILMYHSMCTIDTINVHCCLDNKFTRANLGVFNVEDVKPATKEQRDLLFAKMKEAGYKWNTEKKELKKIVEPKFKVGDWVVSKTSNLVYHVDSILLPQSKCYYLSHDGGVVIVSFTDEQNYHLWTIADAKDGDVLATQGSVFIFKHLDKTGRSLCKSYCEVIGNSKLGFGFDFSINDIHPATKEQRDTLFAKIKEAGYEWNAEKRELIKILKLSKIEKNEDTLLDLLNKMPSCITVDGIDYHFVMKKTIAYMAYYEGEGEGSGKVIFWMAGDPIALLMAMLEKLKEEGLLE